jgi:phenylacetate-CoA ligase
MTGLTSEARAGWQAQRLREIIPQLYDRAHGFRRRMDAAGLKPGGIQTPADLAALPVLRKDDLIALQGADPPFGGLLSTAPGDLRRIFQSPGPIYEPEPKVADYWRWAPALLAAGFEPGDIVLNAFGYHLTPAGAMFEEGLVAIGCTVIPGGIGNQEQQAEAVRALSVTGYVGLPSYLKTLIEKVEALGGGHLPAGWPLRRAFVTAEPLPPSLRALLNDYGLVVRQGYGTAECGNLGYECEAQNGWHVPDDALVQICDLNSGMPLPPGQTGEVAVTLFNPDYALVRFGVGDLSALNVAPCACGRTSDRLVGWQGRIGDAVKVRGMFLHPRQVAEVVARFPEIRAHQAVITRVEHRDELTLRIVLAEGVDRDPLSERLKTLARDALKFRLEVEVVPAETLPPGGPPLRDERKWD